MKKHVLSLAVAASAAGIMSAANAGMYINDKGLGEALVYPMYSAQNGNDTYIHVVNTTADAKAVKIRIIEAENSNEVLDFNLYMSPEDHFAFAVTATEDGGAKLVTVDNSCTVPAIPDADGDGVKEVAFRGTLFDDDKEAATSTTAGFDNTSISRTQVGYIEVIEMGQIADVAPVVDPAGKINVYDAIMHDETGVPADCSLVVDAWSDLGASDGKWLEQSKDVGKGTSEFQSVWNGGGLYGIGQIINVADGTAFGYDAVAIDDLVVPGTGSELHYEPGDTRPDFEDPSIDTAASVETGGNVVPVDFGIAANARLWAVDSLFMTTKLVNDYVVDPAINAETDWVITQPTKTFHVDTDPTVAPYSVPWNKKTACEPVVFDSWDREEAFVPPSTSGPDFSPRPDDTTTSEDLNLCYETTVLSFAADSATNSSDIVTGIAGVLDHTEGWAQIDFALTNLTTASKGLIGAHNRTITDGSTTLTGLPVTGFAVVKYTNSSANEAGALANYAVASEHKGTVVSS